MAVGVLLAVLTVLLSPLLSTPRTTLLNISSTFICPLFSGISFLPLAVVSLSGPAPASLSGAPGAAPATVPPSLKAWCGGGVARGEKRPGGKGIGTAGGGVGAVANCLISSVSCRGGRHCCSSCCIRPISKGSRAFITPALQAKIASPSVSILYNCWASAYVLTW